MTRRNAQAGRTLSLLFIFVVTIVAIVVIFAYFTGVFQFISSPKDSVQVSGVFALSNGGQSSGQLALEVKNTGHNDLVGVAIICPSSQFMGSSCSGMQFLYDGLALSSNNPVPIGQSVGGTGQLNCAQGVDFVPGMIYLLTVKSTFSDGTNSSQTFSLAAQA
ncbi:MAG: hypothetical protein ABSF83_11985 [Nitrososphaerales archaeon]|jgi:hypothetical protein